ncbi:hypothetical protein GCM10023066_56010 [Nocardioides kongjuensis]
MTAEIAQIRGIRRGKDCASPSRHTAFHDVDSMLDFVELLGAETGLPVGIKSAVGAMDFWEELARLMSPRERGVDFNHGRRRRGRHRRGAADLRRLRRGAVPDGVLAGLRTFAELGLTDDIAFIGSAKLGLPDNAVVAFALGADHDQRRPRGDALHRLHPGADRSATPTTAPPASPRRTRGWSTVSTRWRRRSGARSPAAPCARS